MPSLTLPISAAACRVALYTEGTYPQAHGGVSVWVDQLVRGLPDHDFEVRAVTGQAFARPVLDLPANVRVGQVPLWGEKPAAGLGRRSDPRPVLEAYSALLRAMCGLDVPGFAAALRALSDLGGRGGLSAVLEGERAARLTLEIWEEARRVLGSRHQEPGSGDQAAQLPAPTVADALDVGLWLEHALRPLSHRPPEAEVGHAVSNGFAALLALHGLWQRGTPFVLTEHGVYLRERYLEFRHTALSPGFKAMLLRFYRLLCSVAYREAALILPGSHYNRRWEERLGAPPERIHCVYNGIDPGVFPPAEAEPPGAVVSWVGRVDPLKDLGTLIRAFALVRRSRPDAALRLFGGTPAGNEAYERHCRQLAQDLGLDRAVTFEGRVDDITDAYRAGQVVALTSVSEGFPYTVIEAMAMGRPPVATRVGGVPEAVGEAGLVVRPRDANAVAGALLRLLDDPALRARLGTAARERVMQLFTLDGCLEAYRRAYPQAMAGASAASGAP